MRFLPTLALTLCMQTGPVLAGQDALIRVAELRQLLGQPASAALLLDASPTSRFEKGHIPGAISADFYAYGMNPGDHEQAQQRFRRWGIRQDPQQRIVVYDAGADNVAARVYFDLLAHGVARQRVQLLDGGLHQWKAQGGALASGAGVIPEPGDVQARPIDTQWEARLPEFVTLSGAPQQGRLVDALEAQYYFGGQSMLVRAGHVPNATMLPWQELFKADKTFRDPQDIAQRLAHLGLRADQPTIAYCGGGVAAAVPFFAMRALLDWPMVKLYVGSQREYLLDERQLPMWTYAAASPLRERAWLAGWNSPMLRRFDASPVTVLDLRDAQAFARERLPGSINLPATLWRQHRREPARLAELLAVAGARSGRELVLVGERGGLSPDKALALLLLQQLGHAQASLLRDSVDEWALAGGELEKGPPQAATAGATATRWTTARIGSDEPPRAASTAQPLWLEVGPAPTVASGTARHVHLPVRQLLDDDGQPKSAWTLWQILNKAGVERYAEVLISAPDPGDAAAALVLLKLAGFPVSRVLDR